MIAKFLPPTFPDHLPVKLDEGGYLAEEGDKRDGSAGKSAQSRRLELTAWLVRAQLPLYVHRVHASA